MPETTETYDIRGSRSGSADGRASDPQAKAQEKIHEVTGQAQDKTQAAAAQAQAKLREQLDQRSAQAGQQVNQQASDLRAVGETLREQGKERPAEAAERLAGYAEKVGGYLVDRDAETLLLDAEDLGRRQPAAVAAGGLLLGLLASRFLKASSSQRYAARDHKDQPMASQPAAEPAPGATLPPSGGLPPTGPRF